MYDVVIIGSGASGLATALSIDESISVLILNSCPDKGSNTKLAQGGIAATYSDEQTAIDSHIADTLAAGSKINDLDAVTNLVTSSKAAIDFLITNGTKFDIVNGEYDLTSEGAHSIRRIFHAEGDSTGKVIYEALLAKAKTKSNIAIENNATVISSSIAKRGLYQVNFSKGDEYYCIKTNNLVIASGGYGNLFDATSNSTHCNGIGLLIAKLLGLKLSNLHLIQFHPTGFKDSNQKYHLLTESLRGEGARLYTKESGYFMKNYHKQGDIAPRDITSRAVLEQINQGHQVFLDARNIKCDDVHTRFRTVSTLLANSGYNLKTDLIPICPVAHYSIGGIEVDLEGKTNKPGVYAVGEVAMSGVHGANRLASNSLLECIVYGIQAAKTITKTNSYAIESIESETEYDLEDTYKLIRSVLSKSCNIVRTNRQLERGLKQLENYSYQNHIQQLLIEIASDIINSALENDSVGCHYKEN